MGAARIDRLDENLFHNPYARIGQRTFSQNVNGVGETFTLDRFFLTRGGTAGVALLTVSRQANKPSTLQYLDAYSHRVDITNLTGFGANGYIVTGQRIEGDRFAKLQGKWGLMAVWTYSNRTGPIGLTFASTTLATSYATTITRTLAGQWERHFIPVQFNGGGLGTWAYTPGITGLGVMFCLKADAGVMTSATNQWRASGGTYFANTMTQFVAGDYFEFSGIEMIGPFDYQPATPEHNGPISRVRDLAEESGLCRRFFQKTYLLDTPINTPATLGSAFSGAASASSNHHFGTWQLEPEMAVNPQITAHNPNDGTPGTAVPVYDGPAATNRGINIYGSTQKNVNAHCSVATGGGNTLYVHFSAHAELPA